jgi:hypothetical protein
VTRIRALIESAVAAGAVAAGTVLALAPAAGHAQSAVLSHSQSVYADEAGAALRAPDGIACRDDVALVSDTGNKRLLRFKVVNGSLVGGGELKRAELSSPGRVQLDSKGNAYVLDGKTRKLVRLDAKGTVLGTVDVKPAGTAQFSPQAFKLDGKDTLHILDGAGRRVVVVDAAGAVTRQLPLPPKVVFTDIEVEAAGGRIYAIDALEAVIWVAEGNATEFKPLSKSLKEYMNFPAYLAMGDNALIVVDQYGHGVVHVGRDGVYRGRQIAMGWADGAVYYPSQLCRTALGDLMLADRNNNRVQVFSPMK